MLGLDGAKKIYDTRGGPCPSCGLHVKSRTEKCPHCGHEFSEEEIEAIRVQADRQFRKSALWGFIIVTFVLAAMSYLFSNQ